MLRPIKEINGKKWNGSLVKNFNLSKPALFYGDPIKFEDKHNYVDVSGKDLVIVFPMNPDNRNITTGY